MIGVHDGFSEQLECQHQGLLDLPAAVDRSIQKMGTENAKLTTEN
jgi:hypothetical protein